MPPSPAPASRRTQEQRTAETTNQALEATIACLVDRGFARTTVADVAERAGVSRSAVLYHYRSKGELILAALDHLVAQNTEEVAAVVSTLPEGDDQSRIDAAIDVMWSIYRGPSMTAWFELAVASRTDPDLRDLLVEHCRRFDATLHGTWTELFPRDPSVPDLFYEVAPVFLHVLLKGLAADRLGRDPTDADATADLTILTLKLIVRVTATVDADVVLAQLADLTEGMDR